MRKFMPLLVAGASAFLAGTAVADHTFGGFSKSPSQNAVCMTKCTGSAGCASMRLEIYDSDGNLIQAQDFTTVPSLGSVHIIYTGNKTPIRCFESGDSTGDGSVALIRKRGKLRGLVDAMSIPD